MDRLMVTVSGVRGVVGSTMTPQVGRDFGCADDGNNGLLQAGQRKGFSEEAERVHLKLPVVIQLRIEILFTRLLLF